MPVDYIGALWAEGLLLGLGLFAAPGPKDTLLIRQAVSGGPTAAVVALCAGADMVLIAVGVSGIGLLLARQPQLVSLLQVLGAAYLIWFGAQRLRACLNNTSMPQAMGTHAANHEVLRATLLASFANPYAWLDTVVLIGSIGAAKPGEQRVYFALGTMAASLAWFVLLAIGSQRLQGLFRSPRAWRRLDASVALLMVGFATQLLLSATAQNDNQVPRSPCCSAPGTAQSHTPAG